MTRKIELLAPGGDIESIKAAIVAGADAVYCGLNNFNARNRATNITFEDLNGILNLAHKNNCKVYLTLNIIFIESEIRALVNLLNKLVNTRIDGIIVQDFGLFYILSKYFSPLEIHASTQLTTHNDGQIKFLSKLNATQVNLSRELNLDEIESLTSISHLHEMKTEVFVHGSNCLSFSGICYISSVLEGKSGNRGRCSQPCRDQYLTTSASYDFPLNLKDNSAYLDLQELADTGVDSLKIEGRIKKFHYVYTVVTAWREQLDNLYNKRALKTDYSALNKVFNRDFSNAFLKGEITKDLFIDNPRDNSARHFAELDGCISADSIEKHKNVLHDLRTGIIADVKNKIKHLKSGKESLTIRVSGRVGTPLTISVKTAETAFTFSSQARLAPAGTPAISASKTAVSVLNDESLGKKFKSFNETKYCVQNIELENLEPGLVISSKELTSLKKRLLFTLTGPKKQIVSLTAPRMNPLEKAPLKPTLSVLISSRQDLHLCDAKASEIYFQLPDCFDHDYSEFIDIFSENDGLIPWFPSVLIGKNYVAAVDLLQQIKPKIIVTNNTGIAYEANERGIPWIAGPYLNLVNSFSLLCLKENFNCRGAFISNEISKKQIKGIVAPNDFNLYYSIFHPILLLTSRQCLLHRVDGCEKDLIDEECLQKCNRSSAVTTLKDVPLFIEKSKGGYHCIYNDSHFLNTEIITDIPDTFSSFFIDLRDIATETNLASSKSAILGIFEDILAGKPGSEQQLKQIIRPTTRAQYLNGI